MRISRIIRSQVTRTAPETLGGLRSYANGSTIRPSAIVHQSESPFPQHRPRKHSRAGSPRSITTSRSLRDEAPSRVQDAASNPIVMTPPRPKRIVVGVTGATGTLFAIRILQVLKALGIETHLIMSKWALATMKYETSMSEAEVRSLATYNHPMKDMSAPPSSGSFLHDGMIIVPCSMKTLAAVRIGFCDDLISRSADVCLKERRRLVLAVRETPLSDIHLDNMLSLRKAGAIIFPPVPAFYTRPQSIDDLVNQSAGRMLDALDINTEEFERWTGFQKA
ncbi:flavo protein [Delphinella strobiligena]|nr:flavo protein [Delphinella strobiligena]